MNVFFLVFLILTPYLSLAESRPGYTVGDVVARSSGRFCLKEMSSGLSTFYSCSSDKLTDPNQFQALSLKLESFLKDHPKYLFDSFLNNLPKNSDDKTFIFSIAEFKHFIERTSASPSCQSGIRVYKTRLIELSAEQARLRQQFLNNDTSLRSSCSLPLEKKQELKKTGS